AAGRGGETRSEPRPALRDRSRGTRLGARHPDASPDPRERRAHPALGRGWRPAHPLPRPRPRHDGPGRSRARRVPARLRADRLALLCQAGQSGGARKIAITGDPRIPEKLNLSALPNLSGWLADEYGESVTGDQADWDRHGEETVGRLREEAPGSKQESVPRYH